MDQSEVLKFEQTKTLRLSEAIRECGYGNFFSGNECVLGRAAIRILGAETWGRRWKLVSPAKAAEQTCYENNSIVAYAASKLLGVPISVCGRAENMCLYGEPPSKIADYVASQGY